MIKQYKNLQSIMVLDYQPDHDYSSLAKLSEMQSLYGINLILNNLTAEDIEACKDLTGLTWFGVQSYDISSNGLPPRIDPAVFRAIAKQFPKLETLSIIHYDNLNEDDLSPLGQHPTLKKILLHSRRGTGKPSKLNMKAIRAALAKITVQGD